MEQKRKLYDRHPCPICGARTSADVCMACASWLHPKWMGRGNAELSRIAREARDAGMSYGMYVALMEDK